MSELDRVSHEEFKELPKRPVVLVLDNLRSLHNVGSAFRTADAFCLEKIYLCGVTGTPPHREIHKTALGATDTVAWEYASSTEELIKKLKSEGYTICSLEQVEGSTMLNTFTPEANKKYAFVFGNEVNGVLEEVIALSDYCLEIPQFGTKHSLNVSVTVGMVVWHYFLKTQN